jgi:hypothetical protein
MAIRNILLSGLLLLTAHSGRAQNESFKVFLVGDAGEERHTGETLQNLHRQLMDNPNSAVVFLGDNSYKTMLWGIIPFGFKGFDSGALTQQKVRSQLDVLTGYLGHAYFVPGNHDWWNITNAERGKPKLKLEENFIEQNLKANRSIANPDHAFIPTNGDPGPEYVELNNHSLRIIFLDTYRLIINGFDPDRSEDPGMESVFYHKLQQLLRDASAQHQKIIVVAHHPVYGKGPNTGPLRHPHLFKRIKASNIHYPSYHRVADSIRTIIQQYPGLYYASGHIHTLQYYYSSDSIHYIISGAGSKIDHMSKKAIAAMPPAKSDEYTLWNIKGFFDIEFGRLGQKTVLFYDNGSKQRELP